LFHIHKHITVLFSELSPYLKTAAVKLSDNTHITQLVSTSLASCNLKNGFRRFAPHTIRNNNQFSTPYKENAYRHSLQSLMLILLQRSFDSCRVKIRALNQNKNTNANDYRNAGNFPYSPNFGPPEIGAP